MVSSRWVVGSSIGMREHPGKVLKGHHMGGHMGDHRVTVQNVRLFNVLPEKNVLLLEGSVPGATGSIVIIRKAVKKNPGVKG